MELQIKLKKKIVFRSKQAMNKVPRKMFRGFKVRKKVRLMISRLKDSIKVQHSISRGYKQRIGVPLLCLERKLQQYSCG